MLDDGRGIVGLDDREGMGPALGADQEAVALGIVAGVLRPGVHPHEAAVAVLAAAGGNTLGDDPALGVPADMDHLRPRIGLLEIVRDRDGVELGGGIVAFQDGGRVLPGDGGTRFHLRPTEVCTAALADAALGHEVQDAALAVGVAGVPVLNGGVLDIGILLHDDFHDGGMELLLVAHRGGTAFHVAHVGTFVGHDERALELAGTAGVDPEIAGKVHGAAHPLGNVTE